MTDTFQQVNRKKGKGKGKGKGKKAVQGTSATPPKYEGRAPQADTMDTIRGPSPAGQREASLGQSSTQLLPLMQAVSIGDAARPARPGYGTAGLPISVYANFLQIKLQDGDLYDYRITIEPKVKGDSDLEEIFRQFDSALQGEAWADALVHDRSSRLVSRKRLPQPLSIAIELARGDEFGCSVEFFRVLDMAEFQRFLRGDIKAKTYDPTPIISALNLDAQYAASRTGIRIGRRVKPKGEGEDETQDKTIDGKARHFWRDLMGARTTLGGNLELIRGMFTSVRPSVEGLLLNVNACTMAFFHPGNIGDKFLEAQSRAGGIPNLTEALSTGARVTMTYLGYPKRKQIHQISQLTAKQHSFYCEEFGRDVTVEEYYQLKYHINLGHPELPLVDIGTDKKPVLVPAELCQLEPGTLYTARLTPSETREMLKAACKSPKENMDFITKVGLPKFQLEQRTRLGMEVNLELAVVSARELTTPKLTYRGPSMPSVKEGSWNFANQKFEQGARVDNWWALVLESDRRPFNFGWRDDSGLTKILTQFWKAMSDSGMDTDARMPKDIIFLRSFGKPRAASDIRAEFKKRSEKPNFVLVILPKQHDIYSTIKRIGDVEYGIHTIHILMDKLTRPKANVTQYLANIMLKLNSKLGGINHKLDGNAMRWLMEEKTMMVGIDVSHPTGGLERDGAPSVAAVVASVDDSFVQFPASLRIQRGRQEMLYGLRDMLIERLKLYQSRNSCLPKRIYLFRDGVS